MEAFFQYFEIVDCKHMAAEHRVLVDCTRRAAEHRLLVHCK